MKTVFIVIKWALGIGAAVMLIGLSLLFAISPGKTEPFKDADGKVIPGSIAEIVTLRIGNMDQAVILRGKNVEKPVLLFLHGGPGSPEVPLIQKLYPQLEEEFVVAHWEQRGTCKSFSKAISIESMTVEQFVSDTHELTHYLIERFQCDKIYLMGHSWGTFLGMRVIDAYPENYAAYFGVGQVANTKKGEKISYEWALSQAVLHEDKRAKAFLSQGLPDFNDIDQWMTYLPAQRSIVTQYGGSMHNSHVGPLTKYYLFAKEYTLSEKLYFITKQSMFSITHLWDELMASDFSKEITRVEVPVYIFQGIYDYQTPYTVAEEYYALLDAPQKAFFTFESSAHNPYYEETEVFHSHLVRILEELH